MISIKIFIWNAFIRNFPSYSVRSFFYRFLLGNKIARSSAIHHGLTIISPGGVTIGENTVINKNVSLDGRGDIIIGNNVSISAGTTILTGSHDPNSETFVFVGKPVIIEDYVWIGTQALILPGVRLAKGSVVAAGSVVTKSTEPYTIVGGNPARYIKSRSEILNYNPVWKPRFQ